MAVCAICGCTEVEEAALLPAPSPGEPPDFDTRPGGVLRRTLDSWVRQCPACGYCADDVTRAAPGVAEIVASLAYKATLADAFFPPGARPFLCYALILEKLHQFADAGWSTLHAAWACDDAGAAEAAGACRLLAIERWKNGKQVGQLFADDMATEFALVTDLYRRVGEFEHAMVACAEGLDLEDVPPAVEAMLRRQSVLIERRDTSCHSMSELLHPVG